MSIVSFVLAEFIIKATKSSKRKGHVDAMADKIDKVIDEKFGKKSEGIQQAIVEHFLLPLGRRLMREKPVTFRKILSEEAEV